MAASQTPRDMLSMPLCPPAMLTMCPLGGERAQV